MLAFQNHEFKILADFKILALENPEFKILAEFKILGLQNPEFKILADFKVLGFQGKNSRYSLIPRFDLSKIMNPRSWPI